VKNVSSSLVLHGLPFWRRGLFWAGVIALLIGLASFISWPGRIGDLLASSRFLVLPFVPILWAVFLLISPVRLHVDGTRLTLTLGYIKHFIGGTYDLSNYQSVTVVDTLEIGSAGRRRKRRLELTRKNSNEIDVVAIGPAFPDAELRLFVQQCNDLLRNKTS